MIVANNENYMSVAESSELLGVSPITVRNFIRNRKLVSQKVGRLHYVSESELRRFIEERAQKAQKKDKKK